MPQLQWLGDIEKETAGGYLAKALGGGISKGFEAYAGTKQRLKEEAEEKRKTGVAEGVAQSELDLKQKQLEHDYAKLDYDKRKDMYDTMTKLLPSIQPEKQQELTSSPEWITLEKSLGMPSLSGSTISPEDKTAKPGWTGEQKVEAVRANLVRGRVGPKRDMYGISEPKELSTLTDAIDHITEEGLSPSMFENELERYKTPPPIGGKGKGKDKYKVGQKINKGGKTYEYIGNGKWRY